jgi:hypothetical protein
MRSLLGALALLLAACGAAPLAEPTPRSKQLIIPPFSPPEPPPLPPAAEAGTPPEPPGVPGRLHLRLRSDLRGFDLHRLADGTVAMSQGMALGRILPGGEVAWDRAASRGLPAPWSVYIDPVIGEVEGTARGFTWLGLGQGGSAPSWIGYPLDQSYRATPAGWREVPRPRAGQRVARSGYVGGRYYLRASTVTLGGRTLGLMVPVEPFWSDGHYSDADLSDRAYCFKDRAYWAVDGGGAGGLPRLPGDLCVRQAHAFRGTLVLIGMKEDGSVWLDIAEPGQAARRVAVPGMDGCRRAGYDEPLGVDVEVFSPSEVLVSGTITCAGAECGKGTRRTLDARFDGTRFVPEPHDGPGFAASLAQRHADAAGRRWLLFEGRVYERDRETDAWQRVALLDPESFYPLEPVTLVEDAEHVAWVTANPNVRASMAKQGVVVFSSLPGETVIHDAPSDLPLVPLPWAVGRCDESTFFVLARGPIAAPSPDARLLARARALDLPETCVVEEVHVGDERLLGLPATSCELTEAAQKALARDRLCLSWSQPTRELRVEGGRLQVVR